MSESAFGIVRTDKTGDGAADCVRKIRRWALRYGFRLRGVELAWSEEPFALLIATLNASGISAVAVPTLAHLGPWAAAVRAETDLWTMHPLHRWPRWQPTPEPPLLALGFVPLPPRRDGQG
ncbi:hypothetical protein [Nocardia wallacei]|uniref:hypothetical protein n=1 Tax=Nocardia wallacei TaxID=480035 RepID=UPI0024579A02|nr:hypothetical protein [Nocardia wallacei]